MHTYVSNSGDGADPKFRINRYMAAAPLMHVRCSECGCRTWLNEKRWGEMVKSGHATTTPTTTPTTRTKQ